MTKMLSPPMPNRRLSSLNPALSLPVDDGPGSGLASPFDRDTSGGSTCRPRLSFDYGDDEVHLELPESSRGGDELPVGKASNVGRAARRGLVLDDLFLPSSLCANSHCLDRSDRGSMCDVPARSPSRPSVSYESAKPFARPQHSCSQPGLIISAAEPKSPNEEAVRAFYAALHPTRHQNRPANFRPVYDELVDDDFSNCTSGTTKSKAQWWHYWDLLVTSGVRARRLHVGWCEGDAVGYAVELVVGATVIAMQHTATLRNGRLWRIEGPDAAGSPTGAVGRAVERGAASALGHCSPRLFRLEKVRSLSRCSLQGR
eukprot:EG_transcript_10394